MNRKFPPKSPPTPKADAPKRESKIARYREGGEGFIAWAEDYLYAKVFPIGSDVEVWCPLNDLPTYPHPVTGRSYRQLWENQKTVLRQALAMDEDGNFKHRLIIFDWFRGEGKSFLVCDIVLWRFSVFPNQKIVLGANSKDQTKFVHYDIIRDTILNSPKLLDIVGQKNVMEKEIQMLSSSGRIISFIRPISSFSGIVSNITCYTFSEMFDMRNPRFFTQLDGSIRNIPNAFGLIDSTIADEDHILTRLEKGALSGKDPTTFVSYRFSPDGEYTDFWHPYNTQAQLDSYKIKFTPPEYDRYFRNIRPSANSRVFSNAQIDAMGIIGIDGVIGGVGIVNAIQTKHELLRKIEVNNSFGRTEQSDHCAAQVASIESRLQSVDSIYRLAGEFGFPTMATADDLEKLSDVLCTDWAICVGVDRADPTASGPVSADTIVSVTAKGLPGSRGQIYGSDEAVPAYVYMMLHLGKIDTSSLEDIKYELVKVQETFDGIDSLCSEKWGMFDLVNWCEEAQIPFEYIHPSYDLQRGAFTELSTALSTGRFKSPTIVVPGRKGPNILIEQMKKFTHDVYKRVFVSPEKTLVNGVQDDSIYATAYSVYGGRSLTPANFRRRSGRKGYWGTFIPAEGLLGTY